MASWRRVAPAFVGLVLSVATLPQPSQGGFAISRLSGRPGTEVTVSGTLPGDAEKVIIRWDSHELTTCDPASKLCPGDPAPRGFRVTFAVPKDAAPGRHEVWLCIRYCDPITETWSFVVPEPPRLAITGVVPAQAVAGGAVEVSGFAGPCGAPAVLVLHIPTPIGLRVTGDEDGAFRATVTVPKGTFVGSYPLELRSSCPGPTVLRDERSLEVVNHPPRPADDDAMTGPGQAVDVRVGDNDVDPDGDDGYQTLIVPVSGAASGEVQPLPDGTIRYLPRAGFIGQDQFQYRSCDVVGPRDRLDCGSGTATVTVTVQVAGTTTGATATSQGGGPGPASSGQVGGVTSTGPASIGPGPGTTAPVPTIVPGPAAEAADDRRQRLFVLVVVLVTLLLAALSATVWRAERTRRQRAWTRQHVRGQPHPGTARSAVEVDARAAPPPEVRLRPHPDDGVQHLEEAAP